MNKLQIEQAIIVEGRDDVAAVEKTVDTLIIPTHGFGITEETWGIIEKAYKEKGIIILTDPDFSGEEIRKKILTKYPDAINAYVPQKEAVKATDIGIENATGESIQIALKKALSNEKRLQEKTPNKEYVNINDLFQLGLVGIVGAEEKRNKLCSALGIGHANAKTLIRKLKTWEIGKDEFEQAIQEIKEK